MDEVKNKVITVIAEILKCVDRNHVQESKLLKDDLGCDSLDEAEIMMTLEDELNIWIKEEEVLDCVTVGDLITLVEKEVAKGPRKNGKG